MVNSNGSIEDFSIRLPQNISVYTSVVLLLRFSIFHGARCAKVHVLGYQSFRSARASRCYATPEVTFYGGIVFPGDGKSYFMTSVHYYRKEDRERWSGGGG